MKNERKNPSIWFLIVFLITFVVGTVCAFVLVSPYTTKFWFSYFACLIALCGLMFGFWQTSKSINRPSTFIFTTVSIIYVICVIIATVLCNVFPLSSAWLGVIELIILALYIISMIVCFVAHSNISSQTDKERRNVNTARLYTEQVNHMIDEVQKLPEENREIARKALCDVQEKLRYSDPIASRGTEQYANEMKTSLDELEATMNFLIQGKTDINLLEEKAQSAIQNIDAYNRAKMMAK